MHALIVLGGDRPAKALLAAMAAQADLTIAADRGLEAFDEAGIVPDLLVGDMDSVAAQVLSCYEGRVDQRRLSCIKDDTDGVDAMDEAIARGADSITFLGALGGRLDHALANLMLLVRAHHQGVSARIMDETVEIFRVDGRCTIRGGKGDTVSLLPLGRAEGVSLCGFFYPLENHSLASDHPLGISNVVTDDPATVTVENGDLILFHYSGRM